MDNNNKCQLACLRALRIICTSTQSAQWAAESEHFPALLSTLHSSDTDIMLLCVRLVCELLKTHVIEIGFRVVEESVLKRLLELGRHASEDMRDLILEIMFLLTLTTRCRVAVATEGAVELFLERIRLHENTDSFRFATQGLCLCAREAVSRNLMKSVGALQEMVGILKNENFNMYHESLVAAFVWFLFDDASLGLLIRADVTPYLLSYLNRLTSLEYKQYLELNLSAPALVVEEHGEDWRAPSPELNVSYDSKEFSMIHEAPKWLTNSSPESSPYNAHSPPYFPCSPSASLSYSPPASPQSPLSPGATVELHDGYSDALNESCGGSSSKIVPYHFQSADGIHAMIHGSRGPIHDTLLLLSRFSQAKDPSSFFLYLPGFNSLINHVALSAKPNPKCARILNRLTLNTHCFDLLLKKNLIPRLYLRLCTGWSLECVTRLLKAARSEDIEKEDDGDSVDNTGEFYFDNFDEDILFVGQSVSKNCLRVGKLLLSNLQTKSETAYGHGLLSKILSTGSNQLKEACVLSLPYIIWLV